jgi:hypothetical protein
MKLLQEPFTAEYAEIVENIIPFENLKKSCLSVLCNPCNEDVVEKGLEVDIT